VSEDPRVVLYAVLASEGTSHVVLVLCFAPTIPACDPPMSSQPVRGGPAEDQDLVAKDRKEVTRLEALIATITNEMAASLQQQQQPPPPGAEAAAGPQEAGAGGLALEQAVPGALPAVQPRAVGE
jgi:hypothetical protein